MKQIRTKLEQEQLHKNKKSLAWPRDRETRAFEDIIDEFADIIKKPKTFYLERQARKERDALKFPKQAADIEYDQTDPRPMWYIEHCNNAHVSRW